MILNRDCVSFVSTSSLNVFHNRFFNFSENIVFIMSLFNISKCDFGGAPGTVFCSAMVVNQSVYLRVVVRIICI